MGFMKRFFGKKITKIKIESDINLLERELARAEREAFSFKQQLEEKKDELRRLKS